MRGSNLRLKDKLRQIKDYSHWIISKKSYITVKWLLAEDCKAKRNISITFPFFATRGRSSPGIKKIAVAIYYYYYYYYYYFHQ